MSRVLRTLDADAVAAELRTRLGDGDPTVLWADRGDRVLVHAADVKVRLADAGLSVEVPLETAETRRETLTVTLAIAAHPAAPDAVALTSARPVGDERLAARWGHAVQEAVFTALLETLADAAHHARAKPRGFRIGPKGLELAAEGAAEGAKEVQPAGGAVRSRSRR